jgi:hypothetical protein
LYFAAEDLALIVLALDPVLAILTKNTLHEDALVDE